MSMSWASYSGLGFLIKEDELDFFIKAYIAKNRKYLEREEKTTDPEKLYEIVEECISCNEILCRDEEKQEGYLDIAYCDPEVCEGISLWRVCDKFNICYVGNMDGEKVMFVLADKQPLVRTIFSGDFYNSYEELRNEFEKKLEGLIPDSVSIDERIGEYQYAAFA